MQFTPQQLSGAGKYHHGVRIGNWNEDIVLEEIRTKSRSLQKSSGLREIDANELNKSLQSLPVDLINNKVVGESKSNETERPVLCYGDHIKLHHPTTNMDLSSNVASQVHSNIPGMTEYQVSTSSMQTNCLRNIFRVEPVVGSLDSNIGKPVLYGNEVHLAAPQQLQINPATGLCQRPLLLASVPGGVSSATRQFVTLARVHNSKQTYYTRWKFQRVGPSPQNLMRVDTPVQLDEPVQVTHSSTGRSLMTTESEDILNDFGVELNVLCANQQHKGRTHVMMAEFSGAKIGDETIPVLLPNWWTFGACGSIDTEQLPGKPLTFVNVVDAIKSQLDSQIGVERIAHLLHELDQAKDGILTQEEFCWALLYSGCSLSQDEFQILTEGIQSHNSGVHFEQFLAAIQEDAEAKQARDD